MDHNTARFKYREQSETELASWKEFKTWNDKSLAESGQVSQKAEYHFNDGSLAPFDIADTPACWKELTVAEN